MSWYRASTISLTNGSTAVTGAATDFIANSAVGEGLLAPDGKVYEIAAIVSATALTLGSVYLGSTASGQSYAIIPSQSYLRDLALQAATLVNDYQSVLDNAGAGKFGDGTLGSPGIQFSSDSNTGLRRTGTDAVALVTGGVDRITVDAAGAVAVVASLSVAGSAVPTIASTSTLTNKTLALGSNTVSGTTAQFNTALTDGDFATLAGTETLTNKTLTSPAINGGVIDTTSTTATAALGTSSTRLANTAFVQQEKEYLPALSQSLHIGAVVKAIVYDTSKDSDGGAWRKRCADKSWYTETLGGDRWIGQHATISAAWTAAGSTTGAVYQASATAGSQTSGLFYTPTSSTTVTQVYRGVTREFPAVAGIVAESARVVIYDLATGAMWMVFIASNTGYGVGATVFGNISGSCDVDNSISSISAINGQLWVGKTGYYVNAFNAWSGVAFANFLKDSGGCIGSIVVNGIAYKNTKFAGTLAYRNSTLVSKEKLDFADGGIVNGTVNSVAITVLDSSPIDPATGLPVPTIAIASAGGVSVIKDDGTVVNSASTSQFDVVLFVGDKIRTSNKIENRFGLSLPAPQLSAGWNYGGTSVYDETTVPALQNAHPNKVTQFARGSVLGLQAFKENPATPTKGMVAYVTTAYNTGWLPGDIKGCYLADTTAETVTASGELVTNPGPFTVTTGWVAAAGASLSVVSNELQITASATNNSGATLNITTVVGKTYSLTFTARRGTCAGNILFGMDGGFNTGTNTSNATVTFNVVATGTTTGVGVYVTGTASSGQTAFLALVSVKLAEPDRSVKNKGLVINGSLTKTAVASGAALVAYSGFSAANYLEQPYNSDLDFGTGDFCVMGWFKTTYNADAIVFGRGAYGTAGTLSLLLFNSSGNNGKLTLRFGAGSTSELLTPQTYNDGNWHLFCGSRSGTAASIAIDGISVVSATVATNISSALGAFTLGTDSAHSAAAFTNGSLALWRISATAPSADQIAHIYRTELPLFQASAQCTIAGSSTAVTALAYDDTTELLHVGTSWGRTGFKDLLRVDSEATTTGALTSLSASQGVIITGGTSGKVYVPAMLLRDELRRKDEAKRALGKVPVFFDYTATASQTAFVAPKGYTIKAVYHNGTLKRETTTGVYWTRSSDGFAETCTLSAGATVSDWISLMCVRT